MFNILKFILSVAWGIAWIFAICFLVIGLLVFGLIASKIEKILVKFENKNKKI